MRRIDLLITRARERSKNLDFTVNSSTDAVTAGISDHQFLEWANDAQDHLQAAILNSYPNEFIESIEATITSGTAEYTLSDHIFINNKIIKVEYSNTGAARDYEKLDQLSFKDRNDVSGYPYGYIRRGNKIRLVDIPNRSGATLRVTYYRELDDVDIRRGTISGTPSGAAIVLSSPSTVEAVRLSAAEYVCVCDSTGTPLLYNGLISSYAAGTITLAANVSTYLVTGYTLANLASKYITLRAWSTTHSKLPDNCERYIRTYMQKRAMTVDESSTSIEEDVELKGIEADILSSFAENSRDIESIPVDDWETAI